MTDTITIPTFPMHYRLRLAVESANLDPEARAEQIGVHANTVHNYLAGRSKPKRAVLVVIAQLTGVPVWWLEGHQPEGDDPSSVTRGALLRSLRGNHRAPRRNRAHLAAA